MVAWNEDTVNSYQFLLRNDKKFAYTITKTINSNKVEQYYKGTFEFLNDTLYLMYLDDIIPANTTNYLIKEGSGNYLIQPFSDSVRRIFLRFQKINRHLF